MKDCSSNLAIDVYIGVWCIMQNNWDNYNVHAICIKWLGRGTWSNNVANVLFLCFIFYYILTCAEAAGSRTILLSPLSVCCSYVQCLVTTVGNKSTQSYKEKFNMFYLRR